MASASVDCVPLPTMAVPGVVVSQEDFNLFHSIDRNLFSRLVFRLGRDASETIQVMGLWLWLEAAADDPLLISKLLSLPDLLLSALADEAVLCLHCIEDDNFLASSSAAADPLEVPLTKGITESGVSLKFFHDNRLGVLRGITRFINRVCIRAFKDILVSAVAADATPPLPRQPPLHHWPMESSESQLQLVFDLGAQSEMVSSELDELMSRMSVSEQRPSRVKVKVAAAAAVPQDDRTIFLTFSKGYPISESEARDFFGKKLGECMVGLHMQEVSAGEQALYARLVVDSPVTIEAVLDGQVKAKFSINGKHVWARKYVRKPSKTSPRSHFAAARRQRSPTQCSGADSKSG